MSITVLLLYEQIYKRHICSNSKVHFRARRTDAFSCAMLGASFTMIQCYIVWRRVLFARFEYLLEKISQ